MIESNNHIHKLIDKYGRGEILTEGEMNMLEEWGSRSEEHRLTLELFGDPEQLEESLLSLPAVPMDEIWADLEQRIKEDAMPQIRRVKRIRHRIMQYVAAAAVYIVSLGIGILIFMLIGYAYFFKQKDHKQVFQKETAARTVRKSLLRPEKQAVLTLPDNTVVILDTVVNGSVFVFDKHISIRKINADELVYESPSGFHPSVADWHRLAVGGERNPFTIRLPDGTRVQLKSGSDCWYPLSREQLRPLELEGEAFFSVAKNSKWPLSVSTHAGLRIDVLGTVFHVKARPGEPTATVSLVSGSIKAFSNRDSLLLNPGGEVVAMAGRLSEHPIKDETGLFEWSGIPPEMRFYDEQLGVAIRRIASWYRLKVINPNNVRGIPVTGVLHLTKSPEDIVKEMEHVESGAVWLNVKGNTITISDSSVAK